MPVGLYAQGPGGTALAVAIEAARAGADPIATASYPVAMLTTRPAAELLGQALSGLGFDAGIDRDKAWEAARVIEAALGDAASSAPPVSPHVALRAALATVPIGVVAGIERSLRAAGAEDRLDEVLDELLLVRAESGYPPPASPVGRILAGQAIRHVLHARRWTEVDGDMRSLLLGEWGMRPLPSMRSRSPRPSARPRRRPPRRRSRTPARTPAAWRPRRRISASSRSSASAPSRCCSACAAARPRSATRTRSTTTRRAACGASCACSRSPTPAS